MTPEQIKLIKLSFAPVMVRKLDAGKLFYQRLFEIAPEARAMFKSDMNAQAEKLMNMLGIVISGLNDGPGLVAVLENLGRRHVGYGVQEEHYQKVRVALMWTLEQMLGDGFTDQARAAWSEVYDTVVVIMRGAEKRAAQGGAGQRAMSKAG